MTTTTSLPPNHHAHHPGFSGVGGLVAALGFSVGRDPDAALAVDLAAVGPGDRVVDIGCGPGVAVRHAAAAGATSVVGLDPAPVMIRVARLTSAFRRRAGVRYLEGAAEALPLDDASATVVWSLSTVHHWHDLDRGLGRGPPRPRPWWSAAGHRAARGERRHRSRLPRLDRSAGRDVRRTLPVRRVRRRDGRAPPDLAPCRQRPRRWCPLTHPTRAFRNAHAPAAWCTMAWRGGGGGRRR